MSLSAEIRTGLEDLGACQGDVAAALRELDRLQATADCRGELLRRALGYLEWWRCGELEAAIVAELAGEGDGS